MNHSSSPRRVRSRWAALAATTALSVGALTACGGSSEAADDIRLGFFHALSGPYASFGKETLEGVELAVDLVNEDGGVDGRTVALKTADDQFDASGTITAVRGLQDSDILIGGSSSAACLGASDIIGQIGKPTLYVGCATDLLLTDNFQPNAFHTLNTLESLANASGIAMAEKYPEITTWHVFGSDFTTGHQLWEGFVRGLESKGVKVTVGEQQWVPAEATDIRAQVQDMSARVGSAKNEGLFLATYGAGTSTFLKQQESIGLAEKFGALANCGSFDTVGWSLKDSVPEIWNSYDYYFDGVDTPANDEFVAAFEKKYDKKPTGYSYVGYQGALIALDAAREAGSTDTDALIEALTNAEVEVPTGTIRNLPDAGNQFTTPATVWHAEGDGTSETGLKFLEANVVEPQDGIDYWTVD